MGQMSVTGFLEVVKGLKGTRWRRDGAAIRTANFGYCPVAAVATYLRPEKSYSQLEFTGPGWDIGLRGGDTNSLASAADSPSHPLRSALEEACGLS